MNEKIDDFKKFFSAKLKIQEGSLERKVLATHEDYKALRFMKEKQNSNKKKGSNY